ncbi:hypothetical protein GCM10009850_024020 [Nonomuraea monospora]|uniref:Uncharacterized protein n=1 Tax=Nonomuraea monospora TaxID=568818 RepID=A0ABN3CC47_9ACTN
MYARVPYTRVPYTRVPYTRVPHAHIAHPGIAHARVSYEAGAPVPPARDEGAAPPGPMSGGPGGLPRT